MFDYIVSQMRKNIMLCLRVSIHFSRVSFGDVETVVSFAFSFPSAYACPLGHVVIGVHMLG